MLVQNEKVIEFFKEKEEPIKCDCITDLAVKRCDSNCDNNSRHKINYE